MRWFQYGVFCPVFRLHGSRNGHDRTRDIIEPSGGDNELWSFGDRDYEILRDLVFLRERLRPYIHDQMAIASKDGVPVMRPLIFDWPEDETCTSIGDEFLFGDDILFAPIVNQGETSRRVYLPAGEWVFARDGKEYAGGQWITCTAELNEFIAFVKKGASVLSAFQA